MNKKENCGNRGTGAHRFTLEEKQLAASVEEDDGRGASEAAWAPRRGLFQGGQKENGKKKPRMAT